MMFVENKQTMIYHMLLCLIFTVQIPLFATDAKKLPQANEENKCPELTGHVVWPSDTNYQQARLVSNYHSSKNSFPKVIVYSQNAQDVKNAILWARCQNIPIRVRSGGHNHEGFSTGTGAIVIDVSQMKKIQIDKSKNIAIVEPGTTSGQLYNILFREGLTYVGGTCKDVGVSGLILTGGIGPLMRKYGLACDNLLAFDMVDANGNMIHATADNEYKDLFWAACGGGGGNFGVVISLTINVYPVNQETWFNIEWDWNQPIENIIITWQELFLNGDKKWFSHLDIWSKPFPSEKLQKQPVKALGVFYGTPEEAKRRLAPLLSVGKISNQTIELVDWIQAIKLFEDSTSVFFTDKPEYKTNGSFIIKPLPLEAIKTLAYTLKQSSSPLLNVLFFSLGGALQDKSPNSSAFFYRDAKFYLIYTTQWLEEQDKAKQIAELDALRQKLQPYTAGMHLSNPDRNIQDYLNVYYGNNVQRLQCTKQKYDPQNIFRFEQSIPPATEKCNPINN